MKKGITLIITVLMLLILLLGMVITAQAEPVMIPTGNYNIAADGVYQLDSDYTGIITIANPVYNVTVSDSVYKDKHTDTSIVIGGGRATALALTIENLNLTAPSGKPGIDFGSYENKLYISGICNVTGSSENAGIHVPPGVKLVIDKVLNDATDQLTAIGGDLAAGIGGKPQESGGIITISGGTVSATGGDGGGAGIGGGTGGSGGTIIISGGTVTATGLNHGAGIGGGYQAAGGNITLRGGTITATGGDYGGAGIGGGYRGPGGNITLTGTPKVYATGKNGAEHIGKGASGSSSSSGTLKGASGANLSYLRFSTEGVAQAKIVLNSIEYMTNSQGLFCIFLPRSGSAAYTVRKAGYPAVRGTQAISSVSHGIDIPFPADNTPPNVNVNPSFMQTGIKANVTIDNYGIYGTLYLLAKRDADYTNKAALDEADPEVLINLESPTTTVNIDTARFNEGIYQVYVADSAENISSPVEMVIDNTRPAILNAAPLILKKGTLLAVTVNNDYGNCGTLYLVPRAGASYTSQAALDGITGKKTALINIPATVGSIDPTDLADGIYQVYLADNAANTSLPSADIVIDNTLPTIISAAPLLPKKGTPVTVTVNNDYGISGKLYLVPKANVPYTSKAVLDGLIGGITAAIDSPAIMESIDPINLADGIYQIYLTDSAENVSTPSADIVIDHTPPAIEAAEKTTDDTYIDLQFSEGIYGAADGVSKLTGDKLQLVFKPNGGTAAAAQITAVKKNDRAEAASASELAGGETNIRVFIEVTGIASGLETIEIKPADGISIYDNKGNTMSVNQTTGVMLLKDRQAPAVSNGAISISNTTQTGTALTWNKASDLATDDTGLEYCLYKSAADNINTAAAIAANGTIIENYTANIDELNVTGLQPGSTYYFNVMVRDSSGNQACYTQAAVTTKAASNGSADNHSSGNSNSGNIITTTTNTTVQPNETIIPISDIAGRAGKTLEVKTALATFTLPSDMLTMEASGNAASVTLTVNTADIAELPSEVQAQIGNRPVLEIILKLDGKNISWNNPDAPVTVTFPYKPAAEEFAHAENITVWYIDGAGNAVSVPSGRYDPATGTVSFITTHFSKYAVVYVQKSFNDLNYHAWAQMQIEVLAAKGIMSGRTAAEFLPGAGITREEYIFALVRALSLSAQADTNFNDVKAGDLYYEEIGIAKVLGITSGVGNNNFKPEANITRQDMLVLTGKALQSLNRIGPTGTMGDLEHFTDSTQLADYAVNSIAALVKEGLIVGSGGKLNACSDTTRAEAAVFLYKIYNKL